MHTKKPRKYAVKRGFESHSLRSYSPATVRVAGLICFTMISSILGIAVVALPAGFCQHTRFGLHPPFASIAMLAMLCSTMSLTAFSV